MPPRSQLLFVEARKSAGQDKAVNCQQQNLGILMMLCISCENPVRYKERHGQPNSKAKEKEKNHQTNRRKLMARTKESEAEWQSHYDELKSLWLDQRWTAERVREYMSQKHGFHKRSVLLHPESCSSQVKRNYFVSVYISTLDSSNNGGSKRTQAMNGGNLLRIIARSENEMEKILARFGYTANSFPKRRSERRYLVMFD